MSEFRELTIKNKLGLHARAAALLVQSVNRFSSDIFIEKNGHRVNGKSIMGVMMLAAGKGSQIKVEASGSDALEALDCIDSLVSSLFGEAE